MFETSGNTWEWCSTKYHERYDDVADDDLEGSGVCVVRGGLLAISNVLARWAYRGRSGLDYWDLNFGFRLVAPLEYL